MSKDLKNLLEKKLQQNNQRYVAANPSVKFNEGREHNLVAIDNIDPNPYQPQRIFPQVKLEKLATSLFYFGYFKVVSPV